MSELTLASRPASTAGTEGVTSQYEADREVAERERQVKTFDGMVDELLQKNDAGESGSLGQGSDIESKRYLP